MRSHLAGPNAPNTDVDLIIGIRGAFTPRTNHIVTAGIGGILPHTLERWGISGRLWKACDSGADLDSTGTDVLRGWNHVALELAIDSDLQDLPISGLMRTTWDALELFGEITLTGVDAIVPTASVGSAMWQRVATSTVRDPDRRVQPPALSLVQAGRAWPTSPAIKWDSRAILDALAELTEVHAVGPHIAQANYAPSLGPDPFAASDENPFRAKVSLPAWTIDDVAWVTEATSIACHHAAIAQDVQIAVRPL